MRLNGGVDHHILSVQPREYSVSGYEGIGVRAGNAGESLVETVVIECIVIICQVSEHGVGDAGNLQCSYSIGCDGTLESNHIAVVARLVGNRAP